MRIASAFNGYRVGALVSALAALSLAASGAQAQTVFLRPPEMAKPVGVLTDVAAGEYGVETHHTTVTWQVSHFGMSAYTGRFDGVQGRLQFDPKKPEASSIKISIDPKTVATGFVPMDQQLQGEKFFNVAAFPQITFASTKLVKTSARTGKMTGDLTFMGVTRSVTLDVIWNGARKHPVMVGPWLGFSATGVIRRSDFGLKNLLPMVGDDVTLSIQAEFVDPNAKPPT